MKFLLVLNFPIELDDLEEAEEAVREMVDWASREFEVNDVDIDVQGYAVAFSEE